MAAQLPENDINYIKSNVLIASKYKGTLLENKILAYALSQVKERDIGDQDVEYTFTAAELRNVTGRWPKLWWDVSSDMRIRRKRNLNIFP